MKILRKTSIAGVICAIVSIIICRILVVCWRGDYAWEKMALEYVGKAYYEQTYEEKELGTPPLTINAVQINRITKAPESREIRCFFEIRNEAEWKYVKDVLGVKDSDIQFDFCNYYLISINREVESVEFNKEYCTIEQYGHDVRGKAKTDSYMPGTIYIYKIEDKITFYYRYS